MFIENWKLSVLEEKNVVPNENCVEGKPCINIESNSLDLTFSYTYVTMNMKLLEVLTPPSIYNGCSTCKTFWEGKFTGEEKLFSAANMKNCSRQNVRKHIEINVSDKYAPWKSRWNFTVWKRWKWNLQSQNKNVKIRKGVDYLYGSHGQSKVTKYKKARYSIRNVSKKDLSKIIREFEKLPYESYERKRPKNEPADSYFYLTR